VYCSSSITWLTPSLVHNDPRGISPDISMTPAPVTPAIPGHTPHSRAADHPCPPADNSAKIRSSLPPGISATRPPADTRPPARGPMTTGHPQPPSPEGTKPSGRDQAQRPPGPRLLITDATPPANPEAPTRHPNIAQNRMTRSGGVGVQVELGRQIGADPGDAVQRDRGERPMPTRLAAVAVDAVLVALSGPADPGEVRRRCSPSFWWLPIGADWWPPACGRGGQIRRRR